MQCIKCVHKIVCKHYSYANDNIHIGIQINDCKFYDNDKNNDLQSSISIDKVSTPKYSEPETVLLNNNGYADFSKLSNQTTSINAIPIEVNKVVCDRCKNEVFATDIDNCVECGRPVCIDCKVSSFDPHLGTVASTCEKCWSGAEDPIPGQESQVSISFEEEKESWDISDFVDTNKTEEDENVDTKQMDNRRSNKKSKNK